LLDEEYGLGFYEDDDYCIRMKKAGYRLVCLEDVFVYHRGSASFGKFPKQTKELLKTNKRRVEQKFGITYSSPHPRDRQLELVEACFDRLRLDNGNMKLRSKIENRLRVLDQMVPRNWWKRWRFSRRLNELRRRL